MTVDSKSYRMGKFDERLCFIRSLDILMISSPSPTDFHSLSFYCDVLGSHILGCSTSTLSCDTCLILGLKCLHTSGVHCGRSHALIVVLTYTW